MLWSCASDTPSRTASVAPKTEENLAQAAPTADHLPTPPPEGGVIRVGGDMSASVSGTDGDYRCGPCRVDTPLPKGYPLPTPPDAIELKAYPRVRIAEVAGAGNPDRGMNRAFWPLFNHIKSHGIAMTSPVEIYYDGLEGNSGSQPRAWTMAFLYRTPELNSPGNEGEVKVRDLEPLVVLSIGLRGDYSMSLVESGRRKLQAFLDSNPRWRIAGEWRALYYNGPSLAFWNKWAEVQVPVVEVEPSGAP